MNSFYQHCLILILMASTYGSNSALTAQDGSRIYRKYGTQNVMRRLLKEDAKYAKNKLKVDRIISKERGFGNHLVESNLLLFFHVVLPPGQNFISEEVIQEQVDALNDDFAISQQMDGSITQLPLEEDKNDKTEKWHGRLPSETHALLDVRFCIARHKGKRIGIEYIPSNRQFWELDDKIKDTRLGGADPFQPKKYINIWITTLSDTIGGYSQMPGGPMETSGIVIDYRFFGSGPHTYGPYNRGKTLTHLMGNFLGLYDLWNDELPCADDKVEDTPVQSQAIAGCGSYKYISLCDIDEPLMITNFMNNSDDECSFLFTENSWSEYTKCWPQQDHCTPYSHKKGTVTNPQKNRTIQAISQQI